ncbi:MAG: hypothetical protein HYS12_13455 [Planctomycetes bacterium]|nr:hypothetical protein [Planctomycetota bacterium]
MLAILLSLGLFTYWLGLGYALVTLAMPRRRALPGLLLAPGLGLSATVCLLYLINRAGVPIGHFGVALAIALALFAAVVYAVKRPLLGLRQYLPFACVFVLAALATGAPLLRYQFDWVSYCNDDMANYCLAAARFLERGLDEVPDVDEVLAGQSYADFYWHMYGYSGHRPAPDHVLAWVSCLTRLAPPRAFMPLILSMHLVLISGAGAMLLSGCRRRYVALLGCGLTAASALSTLGVVYQLIGQVGGIALLCACVAVFYRAVGRYPTRWTIRHALLAGLLLSGLMLWYPEATPILGLGFFLHVGFALWRRRLPARRTLILVATSGGLALLLLNRYLLFFGSFLLRQAGGAVKNDPGLAELFPFYLLPSGLANLWGFQPIILMSGEPWLSLSIAAGAVLLLLTPVLAFRAARRGSPVAAVTLVLCVLAAVLCVQRASFGLYKIAMYSQPFLFGTLLVALGSRRRWRLVTSAVALVLAAANVPAVKLYVQMSGGRSIVAEIPDASHSRIATRIPKLLRKNPSQHVVLDSCNVVLIKLFTLFAKGLNVYIPSQDAFESIRECAPVGYSPGKWEPVADALCQRYDARTPFASFDMHDPANPTLRNRFLVNKIGAPDGVPAGEVLLFRSLSEQSLFNRWHTRQEQGTGFDLVPLASVRNHLVFVHSKKGSYYYHADEPSKISFTQLEKDPLFGLGTMSALGRHFLFEVLNPTPRVRLVIELSTTLKNDGENQLPPAVCIGTERVPLPLSGCGGARIISPPLTPQLIHGRPYVAIDMGVEGSRCEDRRSGLAALWGQGLHADRRYLVAFGRDISAISEKEYAQLKPPSILSTFPADLVGRDLEYSGLYEDGWVARTAYAWLTQPSGPCEVVVRGEVPQLDGKPFSGNEVEVLVDGSLVTRRKLSLGTFDIRCPVEARPGRRRVELHFLKCQNLPAPDKRPFAAHLLKIGFERAAAGIAAR